MNEPFDISALLKGHSQEPDVPFREALRRRTQPLVDPKKAAANRAAAEAADPIPLYKFDDGKGNTSWMPLLG